MKHNKIIIGAITSIMLISGCNNTSSTQNISSSSIITNTSSSSSSIFKGYVDFADAYSNTKNYALELKGIDSNHYAEIYLDNLFYTDITRVGFVELPNDEGYLHAISSEIFGDYSSNKRMVVYGRSSTTDYLKELEAKTIKALIAENYSLFTKVNENTYSITEYSFIRDVSDHFQTKLYKYATEIQITVGKDDQMEYFTIYEGEYEIAKFEFIPETLANLNMYKLWQENGSIIDERIYDYKTLILDDDDYISVYEGEEVEFTATVVAKDSDGYLYVANRNDDVGHIGIKVSTSSDISNLKAKDIVKLKGVIRTKNYNSYLSNATVTDTNEDAKFVPIFDEDGLVDSMGGGAYAYNLFAAYPQFGDSLYSTFAYVNQMSDVSNGKDTYVDLVCPTQVINENHCFHMEITIPHNLSTEKKNALIQAIQDAGYYSNEGYELSLQNFVIKYDMKYQYRIKLLATEDTIITKRLNTQEKVEDRYGLANFPFPKGSQVLSYKFGGFSNQYLEKEYGLETKDTEGLFINVTDVQAGDYQAYFAVLEEYGFVKYDEIKDVGNGRHVIYQKSNVNLDLFTMEANFEEGVLTVYMWMYDSKLLTSKTVQERLNEKIGSWFNVDNFLRLSGTYDADYTVFELRAYADKTFTEDNPLYCVALDTQENKFEEYNYALIELGYKTYRVNNRPYTYTSRGQQHYVYQKDGVFVDIASYPTTDYTYTGHKEFQYRLEILIYTKEPMNVKTYDDLSILSDLYKEVDPSLAYYPELPSDAVVEVWYNLHDYKIAPVNYGFNNRDEAFVYTENVEEAYEACKEAALEAGYKVTGSERANSITFSKTINGNSYNIFLLKEADKGYLRVMNDIGGMSFMR